MQRKSFRAACGRTAAALLAAFAIAVVVNSGPASADDVEALQPITTQGETKAEARKRARRIAGLLCARNTRLVRAVRVLPGECQAGGGVWECYGQKFVCAE